MKPGRLASVFAVPAGIVLAVAAELVLGQREVAGSAVVVTTVGAVLAGCALAELGHSLVPAAPVWLRLVSSVGTLLLVAAVWQVIIDGLQSAIGGYEGDAVARAVPAIGFFVVGMVGLYRTRGKKVRSKSSRTRAPAVPTHRH
jgi:hypothetical protein